MKLTFLPILVAMSAAFMSGCVPLVLYGPQTYYIAETSAVSAPLQHVSLSVYGGHSSELSVSLGDPNAAKLKHLRFVSAIMTNENGVVTQLRLRQEILENPNSFVMAFYNADYLGHDLRFRLTLLSSDQPIVITFQTRFKSKVVWPKESDYSG